MQGRCSRQMEGKKRVVPGEICVARPERGNRGRKAALSTLNHALLLNILRRNIQHVGGQNDHYKSKTDTLRIL